VAKKQVKKSGAPQRASAREDLRRKSRSADLAFSEKLPESTRIGCSGYEAPGRARTSASLVEPLHPSRSRRVVHGSGGASPYRCRTAAAAATQQIDGGTQLKQRVIRRIDSIDAGDGIEDDMFLFVVAI
jgi:hypothetical protein